MMTKKFIVLVLFAFMGLSGGCKTIEGPLFNPLDDYNGPETLVFIYRPTPSYVNGGGLSPDIFIDENKIVGLSSMGYTRVFLKPGPHTLRLRRVHAFPDKRESEFHFVIPENTRRCFARIILPHSFSRDLLTATLDHQFYSKPWYVGAYKSGSDFVMHFVEEKAALEEIKDCRYITPELEYLPTVNLN